MKFLIGICQQGSLRFLSKSHGGRAYDKSITKHSGILRLLEYGVVLAEWMQLSLIKTPRLLKIPTFFDF